MIPLTRIRRHLGRPLSQFHPLIRWAVGLYRFFVHIFRLWDQRDCFRMSSSLAFESLFSLVPLAALGLWFVDVLGQSEQVNALAQYVGKEFFPSFGPSAIATIRQLATRIRGEYLGTVGAVFTLLVSVWIFVSMENAINAVWGERRRRSFFSQFSTYWTLASLIPLMALLVFLRRTDYPVISNPILGHVLLIFFFFLVNKLVPTPFVNSLAALVGGILSFFLFSLARWLVSQYFTSKYFGIYGEIGVLFLMLLWIYYIWLILLLGTVVTYVVQRFSYLEVRRIAESRWAVFPGEPLAWRAWSILDFMYHDRRMHDVSTLVLVLGDSQVVVEGICRRLAEDGLLFHVDGQYGLEEENAKKITLSRIARLFAPSIQGNAGGATLIWQELSEAFMQVGEQVTLASTWEELSDVRELFDTKNLAKKNTEQQKQKTAESTGDFSEPRTVSEPVSPEEPADSARQENADSAQPSAKTNEESINKKNGPKKPNLSSLFEPKK